MRVVIEFDKKTMQFQVSGDGPNLEMLGMLAIAMEAVIAKGKKGGFGGALVPRKVDFIEP